MMKKDLRFGTFLKRISPAMTFFQRVWQTTAKIPRGQVVTYGDIARLIGTRDARRVGYALHANGNGAVPCHRVVFGDGSLAAGYAFGGAGKQRGKLEAEGVKFTDEGKVDLKACRGLFPIS